MDARERGGVREAALNNVKFHFGLRLVVVIDGAPLIRYPRETFNAREISHAISHAGCVRAREAAVFAHSCLFVDQRRRKELRGRVKSTGEPSGEHVRSFRDSCLEFATRGMTVCRKRGKKIACQRAKSARYTVCPPLTGPFLPFAPPNAVYLLGERTRQRYIALGKKRG